jgi:hypothetical protein
MTYDAHVFFAMAEATAIGAAILEGDRTQASSRLEIHHQVTFGRTMAM